MGINLFFRRVIEFYPLFVQENEISHRFSYTADFIIFKGFFFYLERQQTLFLDPFLINTKDEKTTTFWPKSWTISQNNFNYVESQDHKKLTFAIHDVSLEPVWNDVGLKSADQTVCLQEEDGNKGRINKVP